MRSSGRWSGSGGRPDICQGLVLRRGRQSRGRAEERTSASRALSVEPTSLLWVERTISYPKRLHTGSTMLYCIGQDPKLL